MKKPESQNVEYKRSWYDEYLKWVCGFANAKGGTIWIGIDDDKSVCGIEKSKKLIDYMERKGSGLGLMLDAYAKEVPNPRQLEPKFYSSSGSFHVVLPNLNFDVSQGGTQSVPQAGTQVAAQVAAQVTAQVNTQEATRVKRLVKVMDGREEWKINELMSRVGILQRRDFSRRYLAPSLEGGYVEMTQPNSPKSPTQKYRLTQKGQDCLRSLGG